MKNLELVPISQNFKNAVDWILGAYQDAGVTFSDGFQKDAIQNAAGARKGKNWNNWKCDIYIEDNDKGKFLVIEDSGTHGLTGKNMSSDDINESMKNKDGLPVEERLARFSSMFNSGGNTTGGGLYGAGKAVYATASESYTYYFDSLREDGLYVANVNKCGQVYDRAFEDKNAKEFIFKETGLGEKETCGTRIIIECPKEELVKAIETGVMVKDIQRSWWRIIKRIHGNAGITVNGQRVSVPEEVMQAAKVYEQDQPVKYRSDLPDYRIKKFGLYFFKDGDAPWLGFSYYRKGMKIGDVDLKDIDKKLEKKFWGFIEVDEKWEDALAEIEDKVHFGVSKGKKNSAAYQYLKNYSSQKIREILMEWGIIKNKEYEDKKLKEELQKAAEEVEELISKLGFENLGKGPRKTDFDVRLQNIQYPKEGITRVTSGDSITFAARINSSYAVEKKFNYSLSVINPSSGESVSEIESGQISIASGETKKLNFKHTVTKSNSIQHSENRLLLTVKAVGSGKEKKKELPFFFDINEPENKREGVDLVLHECLFPKENSRRVNFGESLKNVSYLIQNKRNHRLNYKLNISIHNASISSNPKLFDVASKTGVVEPFEDVVTDPVECIRFDQDVLEKYLTQGIIELRARLIANEDDSQYEKGDRITKYYYKLFLNLDDKQGHRDSFKVNSVDDKDDYRRSWRTPGTDRTVTINVGHRAYHAFSEYPDLQYGYMKEQMLKQVVLLYLDEGKYDMFNDAGHEFQDLEPQEAADQVLKKIESVYTQSLG